MPTWRVGQQCRDPVPVDIYIWQGRLRSGVQRFCPQHDETGFGAEVSRRSTSSPEGELCLSVCPAKGGLDSVHTYVCFMEVPMVVGP